MIALYLWPVYHPIPGWPSRQHSHPVGPPPYWLQVNHHFFFVVYSFVAMGIVTVFEWDMFFPDLLDLLVLKTLPIAEARAFLARVAAIAIFIGGFLFDINIFATLVLPAATDPPNLPRFLRRSRCSPSSAADCSPRPSFWPCKACFFLFLASACSARSPCSCRVSAITALLLFLFLFPVLLRRRPRPA